MKQKYFFLYLLFCGLFMAEAQENWHYLNYSVSNNIGNIYAVDANTVFVVTDGGEIHRSLDGGGTWQMYTSNSQEALNDIYFYDSQQGYAVGAAGSILKTIDGGNNWSSMNASNTEDFSSVVMLSSNEVWVVGKEGIVLHSQDNGNTWASLTITEEDLNDIAFRDNEAYIVGNNGTLFYSSDSGNSWTAQDLSVDSDFFALSMTSAKTYFLSGSTQGYGNEGYDVYSTIDNINWSSSWVEGFLGGGVQDLEFVEEQLGFTVASAMGLCDCCYFGSERYTLTNGWEDSLLQETNAANCIASPYAFVSLANEEVGYILLGGLILKTSNGGEYTVLKTEEYEFNNKIKLYPNPAHQEVYLKLDDIAPNLLNAHIIDIKGKKINTITQLKSLTNIETSTLSNGIYFISLVKNHQVLATKKLLIQHE